jgi:phage terminase small subunit
MTPKQKLFIKEYLVDLNATRAAIAAGYSERTAGQAGARLLKNVNVAQKLAEKAQKQTEKLEISSEYVLGMIKQTVERCSQAVEVLDREGHPTGMWKEDSFAVLKGCELLGKYLKLFTDKVEHSGNVELTHFDTSHLTDEQLEATERLVESALSARSDKG